jgi:hypothetical protein
MFVRQRVSARFFANSLDTARLVAERGVCGYFGNSTGARVPLGCGEEQADRRWLAEYGGGGHAGLVADNPKHLGGAIDAPAGDKAARFLQLCDAFDIPIVSLCDTPGFMVGPEAEKTVVVRHVARMFVTGASLTVPLFGIVLRKAYGLGAQSMIGGGFHTSFFTMAWRRPASSAEWAGRLCAPRLPQGDGSDRRAGRARKVPQRQGRAALRQRQGGLDRPGARNRRSDRPLGDAALDHGWIAIDAAAYRTQAPLHRCVVSRIARGSIPPTLCGASQISLNRTDRRYIDHVLPRRSAASNQASCRVGLSSRRYNVAMLRRLHRQQDGGQSGDHRRAAGAEKNLLRRQAVRQ